MLVNNGLNLFASAIANEITHGAVGTSNTEPTETDNGLGSQTSGTFLGVETKTTTNNIINVVYRLPTSAGNGQAIKEFGLFKTGETPTLITRNRFTSINKTSNVELIFKTQFLVERL